MSIVNYPWCGNPGLHDRKKKKMLYIADFNEATAAELSNIVTRKANTEPAVTHDASPVFGSFAVVESIVAQEWSLEAALVVTVVIVVFVTVLGAVAGFSTGFSAGVGAGSTADSCLG